MTEWTKEEDEAFNMVEKQSNLGKQILRDMDGQPYYFDIYVSPSQRNIVLEEVALEFEKMPFGDTESKEKKMVSLMVLLSDIIIFLITVNHIIGHHQKMKS